MRSAAGSEGSETSTAVERNSGDRIHEVHDVPAVDGQLLDAGSFEGVAERRIVRHQDGRDILHIHHHLSAGGAQQHARQAERTHTTEQSAPRKKKSFVHPFSLSQLGGSW